MIARAQQHRLHLHWIKGMLTTSQEVMLLSIDL